VSPMRRPPRGGLPAKISEAAGACARTGTGLAPGAQVIDLQWLAGFALRGRFAQAEKAQKAYLFPPVARLHLNAEIGP
jgi:hypothetical protein